MPVLVKETPGIIPMIITVIKCNSAIYLLLAIHAHIFAYMVPMTTTDLILYDGSSNKYPAAAQISMIQPWDYSCAERTPNAPSLTESISLSVFFQLAWTGQTKRYSNMLQAGCALRILWKLGSRNASTTDRTMELRSLRSKMERESVARYMEL